MDETTCSRICLEQDCDNASIHYGKYCGVGHGGCEGERSEHTYTHRAQVISGGPQRGVRTWENPCARSVAEECAYRRALCGLTVSILWIQARHEYNTWRACRGAPPMHTVTEVARHACRVYLCVCVCVCVCVCALITGEEPCDAADACCKKHDICVEKSGLLNANTCHAKFLFCLHKVEKSGKKGFSTKVSLTTPVCVCVCVCVCVFVWCTFTRA